MRTKLLAVAALLAAVAGGVVFISWDVVPPLATEAPASFGSLEIINRRGCITSACVSTQCQSALADLNDGGVTDATLVYVDCLVRLGARARAQATDAGVIFNAKKYQQVRLIAVRRGDALGVVVDDAGWPSYAVQALAYPCAWRPTALAVCGKINPNPGPALDPGLRNTMQPGAFVGVGCQLKACSEVAGDTSDPDA